MPRSSVVSRVLHRLDPAAPTLDPERPWWTALDPEFSTYREAFELHFGDHLPLLLTKTSDLLLRTLGAGLVGGLAMPLGYHRAKIEEAIEAADFYGPLAAGKDADAFYRPPAADVTIHRRPARLPGFRPDDGVCEDISFQSPFEPRWKPLREDYLSHRANRTAHARIWRHQGGPRPTVIAVHGFSADLYLLNEWFFALPELYRLGCDVLLFTLPFHGRRQARFSPFSGHGYFAGGMPRVNEAMAQAVHDFQILAAWLTDTCGVPAVGATGVSLGGLTVSVAAAVEERLRFVIPNVPLVSLADLVLEWWPMSVVMRAVLKKHRLDLQDVRRLLAVSSPLTWTPRIPRDRRMIIGGVGDRLAPPKHARLLWEHWDHCRIHWFPGSHLFHLDRGDYLDQMGRFLGDIGFLAPSA